MRIYKPWLYPDIIFSIYGKLTGLHKVYKTLHKLPNQVNQPGLNLLNIMCHVDEY